MKNAVKRITRDERGKVLVLALIVLVIGGLIMTPLLGLMSTGLTAGRVYERKTAELYAADAGVEYAIHWLLYGRPLEWGWVWDEVTETWSLVTPLDLNGVQVGITVEALTDDNTYKVAATAKGPDGGTTVLSSLWAVHIIKGCANFEGPGNLLVGDVYITEDATATVNAKVQGNLVVGGDLTMQQGQTSITGDVSVTGDVTLEQGSIIIGNVCAGGDLTLYQSATITGDVFVGGTLTLKNSAQIIGDVFIYGDLFLSQGTSIHQDVYIWGNITFSENANADILGNVYAYGDITTITLGHPHSEIHGIVYATGDVIFEGKGPRPDEDECPGDCDYALPECPEIPAGPLRIYTYELLGYGG